MTALVSGQQARAIYDYAARAPDELSFKRNDVITVLKADEEDDGWYHGKLGSESGLFPNNYVQLLQSPPAGATPVANAAAPVPDYVRCENFEGGYKLQDALGRGRFSQVRRAMMKSTGQSYAVKMMDLNDPELGTSMVEAEKEVLADDLGN